MRYYFTDIEDHVEMKDPGGPLHYLTLSMPYRSQPTIFADVMVVDASTRISTHGPRRSRREEWRTSKGMTPRPSKTAMNRQGGVAARRKAGRSKRRR